jgi:hypothetical protein
MTHAWIPTLLLIAALALLPAWVVGAAALGAAVALWLLTKARESRKPKDAERPLPANVVRFPQR